jgi:hypothetical protein
MGFYTKAIVKDFCVTASDNNLVGFLMPGKPAIACLEGQPGDIAKFIKECRTQVFGPVPASMRKMNVTLVENHSGGPRRFRGFTETPFENSKGHKRSDMADMGALRAFLLEHGVPESLFLQVSMARNDI